MGFLLPAGVSREQEKPAFAQDCQNRTWIVRNRAGGRAGSGEGEVGMGSPESVCWRRRRACQALLILALLGLHGLVLVRAEGERRSLYSALGEESGTGMLALRHKYADREGSSFRGGGKGMTREHFELLREHDRARRQRFLLREVAEFRLGGKPDPDADGLYYTSLFLGSPSQRFFLQVDTGSDLTWVYCYPCSSCPSGASTLGFEIQQYDPTRSKNSSIVGCTDVMCKNLLGNPSCDGNGCDYQLVYADKSSTSGRLIRDTLTYTQLHNSAPQNTTASIVFGCGYKQTGDLASSNRAVDGIIGFGQSAISMPSQLYAEGQTPNTFAHCLEGEGNGGGVMVLGAVDDPDLVYTPMVPRQSHYNAYLQSIAVGGVNLSIPRSAFATDSSTGAGTIFDSGTTLALLSTPAYDPTYSAILEQTSSGVRQQPFESFDCFIVPSGGSINDYFPNVTLYFSGAAMQLTPKNYLFKFDNTGRSNFWCWGWTTSPDEPGLTILGDIVLKDRLVVYDNVQKRIGWADYNCNSPVNVSADQGPETVVPSPLSDRKSRGVQLSAGLMGMLISMIMGGYFALLH